MILINTCHIQPDIPLDVSGSESPDILDLPDHVSAKGKIHYQLSASMAGQDLLVRGTASVKLNAECARCADEIHPDITANDICIMRENCPDQEVDITDEIREEILLAVPNRFLCSEECQGLCPHCGANLNREKCTCKVSSDDAFTAPSADSPWSVLDQLGK